MELGIGKAKDNGEHGSGDVAEEKGKKGWDLPVLALSNNDVEITADLVALRGLVEGLTGLDRNLRNRRQETKIYGESGWHSRKTELEFGVCVQRQ